MAAIATYPRPTAVLWTMLCLAPGCSSDDRAPRLRDWLGTPMVDASAVEAGTEGLGGSGGDGGTESADGGRGGTEGGGTSAGGAAAEGGSGGTPAAALDASAGGRVTDGGASDGGSSAEGGEPDGGSTAPCPFGTFAGDVSVFDPGGVNALSGYTAISGELYIGTNFANPVNTVTDLSPLHCLTSLGALVMLETPLTSLAGLENLRDIGILDITNAPNLVSLSALEQLAISGNLRLGVNATLADLGAATDIVSLGGTLTEWSNPALDRCTLDQFATRLGVTCTCSPNSGCP